MISNFSKPGTANSGQTTSGSSTPSVLRNIPRKLRPYALAVMAFRHGQHFQAKPSVHQQQIGSEGNGDKEQEIDTALSKLYVGISAVISDTNTAIIAIAIRDTVYLLDFAVKNLQLDPSTDSSEDDITDYIIGELSSYERKLFCKFLGAGLPYGLIEMAPKLCSRLWAELDIVPISFRPAEEGRHAEGKSKAFWDIKCVDEQADSMARKCIMCFGPNDSPLLQVAYRGLVQVDAGFHAHMCTLDDYRTTCGDRTWTSVMKLATELKKRETKIAFFSSTPQGGGVALMRHALVRFARVMGVQLSWYVPKPRPGVFRITKNVHNILQGVSAPDQRISSDDKNTLKDWIHDNATRYWLSDDGPLLDPSKGGADIIVVSNYPISQQKGYFYSLKTTKFGIQIDDPQMPGLIPLAKKESPQRPILYRSHIQIRNDLANQEGTPQADIWEFLWANIKQADMFISHPMPIFVPRNVDRSKVAYMPATTDWLDGLNKTMADWDMCYYGHNYNLECLSVKMPPLKSLKSKYFIQVARFDPSKGIPDCIKGYAEFHRLLQARSPYSRIEEDQIPQLLIVGNSSIDDPDATTIYDSSLTLIQNEYPHLLPYISLMRLPPSDQTLNTLLSNAHIVLQLSTREGFEVKVSEALHKGRPVIATRAGGIPLQVKEMREENGEEGRSGNGFIVEPGDWKTVGKRMMELWDDEGDTNEGGIKYGERKGGSTEYSKKWEEMSRAAREGVSDEVGTVGNALCWFYLAERWTRVNESGDEDGQRNEKNEKLGGQMTILPQERWVFDLARTEAGCPFGDRENRLPREWTEKSRALGIGGSQK